MTTTTTATTTTTTPNKNSKNMKKSVENTVFVRFVPQPQHKVMRHQVEDIFSQIGPIKKSAWINSSSGAAATKASSAEDPAAATATSGSSSKGYGFVKYVSQEDARAASKELDDTKIQMEGRDYTLKVELASLNATDNGATRGQAPTRQTPSKGSNDKRRRRSDKHPKQQDHLAAAATAPSNGDDDGGDDDPLQLKKKSSRIILRNLSFYAKEKEIRNAMEREFGEVVDVHLPKVQNNNVLLGFAFVTFEDESSARRAVERRHVDIHKRTVNMDWSVPKNVHQQQQKERNERRTQTDVERNHDSDQDDDDDGGGGDSDSTGSDEKDDDDESSGDDENHSHHDEEGNVSDAKGGDDDDDDDERVDHDELVDKKCCLFLRNLPFDATRHDLFQLFSKYGHIKGIYLVKDKDTGMLKGTAFVTYSKPTSAQRAMDDATSAALPEGSGAASFVSQRQAAKDGNATSTAGSASNKGSLPLKGRKILVDFAVDKETAATFDSKEHQAPSADRRNLYLQAESRVESSSSDPKANNANTWDDLPSQDQKKRQTALKDKTTKLQSPIFFINPHRLSFRNMAKHVDEAGLQQLCELAVTRGLEKRLVGARDQIAHWKALGEMTTREILAKVQALEDNNDDVVPGWDKSANIKDYVPSVFIDRDFGPTGKKKDAPSRGFGFAEFTHHAHALACLRELNNNPAYSRDYAAGGKAADATKKKSRKIKRSGSSGGGGNDYIGDDGRVHVPRLIVDFTVENKIKAKKQAERRIQQQLNQQKQKIESKEKKKSAVEDSEDGKNKRKSRGAKQREKKRLKRESGEEEAERRAELQSRAMAEARRELRKERSEQKRKQKEEMKRKSVKPPAKKQRHNKLDEEDEKFENIVRSYATELESAREGEKITKNARASLRQKRWFE